MPTPTLYETAFRGEPMLCAVEQPHIDTRASIWRVGGWAVDVPPCPPQPVPEAARLITLIRDRTDWSARKIAGILGVSHSTVRRFANGQRPDPAHSGDVAARLRATYDVVDRVYLLFGRDHVATARLLGTELPGRLSPEAELQAGNFADAYLAAIDAIRPREQGILVGDRPRRDGATAALHD